MNRSLGHLVQYRNMFQSGLQRFPIYVSQDCNNEEVLRLLRSYDKQITVLYQPDHSETGMRHLSKHIKGSSALFFIQNF